MSDSNQQEIRTIMENTVQSRVEEMISTQSEKSKEKELLVLVDGSSYFYRAFHALPPLTNSKGQPTGAIYGVVNMINRLIRDYPSAYVGIIFDAKGKTFRDELYPEYKANRPPMPDDLRSQHQPLLDIIQAIGLPLIMVDGVEADDVIGTLAQHAHRENIQVIISTGDKDMAQLVNDGITLINTMTNTLYTREKVIEKFGVPPERIVDYLTLVGDTVDNVPGVSKVGPKTAVKWLTEFGDLDGVISHAFQISGKVGENLVNALNWLPLAKTLVTIKCDCDLDLDFHKFKPKPLDIDRVIDLYQEYEFKTWLKEVRARKQQLESGSVVDERNVDLLESITTKEPRPPKNYKTILTQEGFLQLLKKLENAKCYAIDTETTSLNVMDAELVGISFSTQRDEGVYIPLGHDYTDAPLQLTRESVLSSLKPILEASDDKKILQNAKFDINVLANYGIALRGIAFDTMLESYVLNASASRHDMGSLATKYLGVETISFEDIAGKGVKQITFNQIEIEPASQYACEDADITFQLHEKIWPQIDVISGLKNTFSHIEMPLLSVLAKMERQGVLIDPDLLITQSQEIDIALKKLEVQAYELAGEEFNLSSPKQLAEIFYTKLNIPILAKTPTGQPSTAEPVLQELALDFPLPKIILEHRSLSKLKSTYTDKLPLQINTKTKRVHTSYNQAVAATGRLSSTDPNLQNIPVRSEQGRRIRQAFIAPPGMKILAADYSQIELRLMAHLSDDHGLKSAFKNELDIHTATASEVFGVPIEAVTPNQRRDAKAINFGLIYGMSAFGLAKQINASREAAQRYIYSYFERYPGVKNYMESTRRHAHEMGYVETLYGRRLYLPEIHSRNQMRARAAERAAINAPLQGSAADIIKLAMIAVDRAITENQYPVRMIMQVHDELVFEVADHFVDEFCAIIKPLMCNVIDVSVPMELGIGVGLNWDEAH